MRRWVLLALLALAALPAASATAAPACTMPHAHTIAQDRQARVFSVAGKGAVRRRYFGCVIGRKPRLLAQALTARSEQGTATAIALVRLAGTWVGWHTRSTIGTGAGQELSETLDVRSLGSSRRRLTVPITGRGVSRFELLQDGTAFWVLADGDYREIDAVAHDATAPTPLAYTRGIDSSSVAATSTTVTWTQSGTPRAAPLSPPAPPPSGLALGPQGMDARFGDCGTLVPPALARDAAATQLAPAPDGTIVAAGTQSSGTGDPSFRDTFDIARFTRDGRLDAAFGRSGAEALPVPRGADAQDAVLTDAVVQPDGDIVLAGYVRQNDAGDKEAVVMRVDPSGALDPTFGTGGVVADAVPAQTSADIRAIRATGDGTLVLAGQRDDRFYVARLLADGRIDPTFGTDGVAADPGRDVSHADALAVEPDGTFLAGGQTASEPMLIHFTADGSALSGDYAGPPAASGIVALAPLPDGGAIAVGTATNVVAQGALFLARYDSSGAPAAAFGSHGFALDPDVTGAHDVAVAPDGGLYVTAAFALRPEGYAGSGLLRYGPDGRRDVTFGLRGALGGVSSFGLVNGDVLLDGAGGVAYTAQQNGRAFGVTRFAVSDPATTVAAGQPAVCAMAIGRRLKPVVRTRAIDVSLRLRAPARLRLRATARIGTTTVVLGGVTVLRPYVEGAVATIPVSAAAARRLAKASSAAVTITAGAPGGPAKVYTRTVTG